MPAAPGNAEAAPAAPGTADRLPLDDVLQAVGNYGRFQWATIAWTSWVFATTAMSIVSPVFTARNPHFECRLGRNDPWEPCEADDACHLPEMDRRFGPGELQATLAASFDLVCDRAYLVGVLGTIFFVGVLVGAGVLAWIADKQGRRFALRLSLVTLATSSLLEGSAPGLYEFAALRFLTGFGVSGAGLIAYIHMSEVLRVDKRAFAGVSVNVSFALGEMFLALPLAYYAQHWRVLKLCIGILNASSLMWYSSMLESPRWLLVAHRPQLARAALLEIARRNGRGEDPRVVSMVAQLDVPSDMDDENPLQAGGAIAASDAAMPAVSAPASPGLFDDQPAAVCAMVFGWVCCSFVYYGLSLGAANLPGESLYVSSFLLSSVEIPGIVGTLSALDSWMGRKGTTVGCLAIAGASCLVSAWTEADDAKLGLAIFGKLGISAAFSAVYMYAGEIFPTSIRGKGMALCSQGARLATLLAPEIARLRGSLSFLIFGTSGLLGAAVCMVLPETRGKRLKS